MRERIRFENELVSLGLLDARPPQRDFEATYEDLEPFLIKGGLYSPEQKDLAWRKGGLILTANNVGRQEAKLAPLAPPTVSMGKQLHREDEKLWDGKLREFVARYNEFGYLFEEILRAIGRLRDLLSAGAPETPEDMTARQRFALRPLGNLPPQSPKWTAYNIWRTAQRQYAVTEGVNAGAVFMVTSTGRDLDQARHAFWAARDRLLDDSSKFPNKPKFELIDLNIGDVASIVGEDTAKAAAVAGIVLLTDQLLEARKKRKEYDAKMKEYEKLAKSTNKIVVTDYSVLRLAGETYWQTSDKLHLSVLQRNWARDQARQLAARCGDILAPQSTKQDAIVAEIRLPLLVSDAWRALSVIGPPALEALSSALKHSAVVVKAYNKFLPSRPDPHGVEEITNVRRAFNTANRWKNVLTTNWVGTWTVTNNKWQEIFRRFNQ